MEGHNHMSSRDEIYEKVRSTLVDALGVDDDEVTLEATLADDLGAESIDFLDIVFRLEKNFGIKIPRGELFPEDIQSDPDLVQDGKFTERGLTVLRERLPYVDLDAFAQDPSVTDLGELFTVEMLVRYVESKVASP
jgi:acyl carrier protein